MIVCLLYSGNYLRVVDAVKGPFYPTPPPMPTFKEVTDAEIKELFAPVPENDPGKFKEPLNPL